MANDVATDPPKSTIATGIDGAFKIAMTALVGFMGWQQSSLTSEISAARIERQDEAEKSRKEREQLTAWALGITSKIDHTAAAVGEVKADAAAAKVAATTLKADVANVQRAVVETKKAVSEIQ